MKKLIFAMLMLFGVAAVNAQDTTSTSDQYRTGDETQQDQERDDFTDNDVIMASELPANVTQQLQSDEYRAWTVSKAYRKMKDGETIYKVELTNGDEKKKLKFDADGNLIDKKDKDKHKDKDN